MSFEVHTMDPRLGPFVIDADDYTIDERDHPHVVFSKSGQKVAQFFGVSVIRQKP